MDVPPPPSLSLSLSLSLSPPGSYRPDWKWRESTSGTSCITTTPREACGTDSPSESRNHGNKKGHAALQRFSRVPSSGHALPGTVKPITACVAWGNNGRGGAKGLLNSQRKRERERERERLPVSPALCGQRPSVRTVFTTVVYRNTIFYREVGKRILLIFKKNVFIKRFLKNGQ